MGIFRFKRFSVKNERSAMKVNTDGVLLGTCMTVLPSDVELLDVGTGTGTVALIAAQRLDCLRSGLNSNRSDFNSSCSGLRSAQYSGCRHKSDGDFRIDAIDIDKDSADEAAENFASSPWGDSLVAENISLDALDSRSRIHGYTSGHTGSDACAGMDDPGEAVTAAGDCAEKTAAGDAAGGTYDFIFSNPPYFESSLKAPDERRRAARHAETMSYRDILHFSARHLKEHGRVAMILPAEFETELRRYAASCGLFPFRILRIKSVARKEPYRIIAEFSREARGGEVKEEQLVIQDGGRYTHEYCSITHDFLLGS